MEILHLNFPSLKGVLDGMGRLVQTWKTPLGPAIHFHVGFRECIDIIYCNQEVICPNLLAKTRVGWIRLRIL